jgi:hypothetical protein
MGYDSIVTTENGLAEDNVTHIVHDSRGFLCRHLCVRPLTLPVSFFEPVRSTCLEATLTSIRIQREANCLLF